MQVIELHTLAIRELHTLSTARYLPHGWNKSGSRKSDAQIGVLHKHLLLSLESTPDKLMAYPKNAEILACATTAAQERTLQAMVRKFVDKLSAQPELEQADAFGFAELTDQGNAVRRAKYKLEDILKELAKVTDDFQVLQVDVTLIVQELKNLSYILDDKANTIERNKQALIPVP